MNIKLSGSNVFQNAWVVADFDKALEYWTKVMGVGPFFFTDYQSSPDLLYRGSAGNLAMRVAWAQAGDAQIELIDPQSPEPNVYRDLVPAGQTRFHHVCLWSHDYDADLAAMEAAGYATAMASGPAPSKFAYFDTSAENGHMIEILEHGGEIMALFDGVRRHAENWDGSRPLRELPEAMA